MVLLCIAVALTAGGVTAGLGKFQAVLKYSCHFPLLFLTAPYYPAEDDKMTIPDEYIVVLKTGESGECILKRSEQLTIRYQL